MFNRSVNKVILIGNLGKDVDIRYMPNGTPVANLTLATTESWKDKQSGERREKTEWHRLTVFRRLGEMCGEYLKKGAKIYVEGRLQTRKWQAQDGQDRYTTEIIVDQIQMMDSRNKTQSQGQQQGFDQTPKKQYYDQDPQQAPQKAPGQAGQKQYQQNAPAQQSWGNAPQNRQQPEPAGYGGAQQAAPQQQIQAQYNEPSQDFDEDIPF